MSVFVLKLIAVVSMFIDHLTYTSALAGFLSYHSALYRLGRTVGRAAFLLYAFLLVNGFEKTRDRKKYLSRLVLFAALSQIPFTLAFTAANYRGGPLVPFSFDAAHTLPLLLPLGVWFWYVCHRRFDASLLVLAAAFALGGIRFAPGGVCLLGEHLNVFYTLAVSMALMMTVREALSPDRSWSKLFFLAAALAVEIWFVQRRADYGLMGVGLILGQYFLRENKALQLTFVGVWSVTFYYGSSYYIIGALLALIPLILYNGRLGAKIRGAFYLFYPVHLALLGICFRLLTR